MKEEPESGIHFRTLLRLRHFFFAVLHVPNKLHRLFFIAISFSTQKMTLHVRLLLLVLIIFLFFSHSERCCRYVLLSHLSNAACFGLIDQTNVQSNNNKAKKEKTSNNRHIVFISLIIIVVMLGIAFEQSVSQPISYSNSQSAE